MSTRAITGSGQGILLVDDMDMMRDAMGRLLQRSGFNVECAENGAVAVAKFKERRFDLVIMDLDMPVMNGFDAAKSMRAYEAQMGFARTPIIGNSGDPSREARALEAGMDECNAKMSGAPLQAMLGRYFSNARV